MPYIGKEPTVGNFQVCDAISVVNGQAAYTMQVSSTNVEPESVNHMLVSLNGILQKPGSSFTINGATITFASNLATGDVIDFIILLGNVLDIGQPSDASITSAALATTFLTGETDIGGALADADLFLVDDGAGGTLRKTAASRIKTYIGDNTPAFYAYLSSSAQTISNATATKMTMNTELFDSDGTYDHSTNYRFTPATSGKYFITAQLRTGDTNNFDAFQIMIYKNGSEDRFAAAINNNNNSVAINTIVDSDDNDYFEVYCYHNKGSNLDISVGANNTFFGAYKIIGA